MTQKEASIDSREEAGGKKKKKKERLGVSPMKTTAGRLGKLNAGNPR